jgi:putative ABC transport system substrate-binding protein
MPFRFAKALGEIGYVEGQDVTVEYHWLDGQYDRLPALMADLVRRRVAVIATPGGNFAAQAAKAATSTIPIVFGVGEVPHAPLPATEKRRASDPSRRPHAPRRRSGKRWGARS